MNLVCDTLRINVSSLLYSGNSKRDEIFVLHVISAHRELRSITLQRCQSD